MSSFGPFRIADKTAGCERTFIIAEIGQNHQGDMDMAKKMIATSKAIGADCVKFQKSCLKEKFTEAALQRVYDGENSWGRTYGEHKTYLEFTIEQYKILQEFASELDIIFTASAMDVQSLQELQQINVPVIKIGSGDANNVTLLSTAAKHPTPLIISTGMQSEEMVRRIVEIMESNAKDNFCLLHCVSSYPTEPKDVCLRMINYYRNKFPGICIGYSGHEQGIAISIAAVLLGAKIIERHFTLDKKQKGTDHNLSLEPNEFKEMISRIRDAERISKDDMENEQILEIISRWSHATEVDNVRLALSGVAQKKILDCEMMCRMKLGKSLVYAKSLSRGPILTTDMIVAKVSEPFGISAERFDNFIGQRLVVDVRAEENLMENHFISNNED
ncbi:sialic acid synthase [Bradysia coprophila]|uniref:sialic acid synthase n=1 Tax=Bradysia coprophila TaxID=38358 RepID=UPI00187D960C|nr:sialic acid synthase [Bradysia coprophila]